MLGDVDQVFGRDLRHPRWRHGPHFSSSRKRNRPVLRRHGKRICELLDSQWLRADQPRENVEVHGEFFYDPGNLRKIQMVREGNGGSAEVFSYFDPLSWSVRLFRPSSAGGETDIGRVLRTLE